MNRRWLVGGLAASLALNLFLAGAAGTYLVKRSHAADGRRAHAATSAMSAADSLDVQNRHAYRRMIRREGRAARPLFRQAKAARREAAALFSKPDYDRAAVAALLERSRALENRARAQLENAMLDFATPLSPRERAVLARPLRRGLGVKGHKGARRAKSPDDRRFTPPRRLDPPGRGADEAAG